MTIQQCKYVVAVSQTGSFNEAAKKLFIAQSTLSLGVKALEQELNIQIFERTANGVYLTQQGIEFLRYANQIVEQDDFITKRYTSAEVYQSLHISTQHYDFIADIFGNLLRETKDEKYNFSLKEIQTYDVIFEVETARSDIGIIAIKDTDYEIMKRYLNSKRVTFNPLLTAKPHVFLRKEHPLSKNESLSYEELKAYPYVSYEQGQHNLSFFTEEISIPPHSNKHIEISDRATLMNVLLITDSYTIGTGIMPSALNRGDIISIPLQSNEYYNIGYILNADRKVSPVTQKFIDMLNQYK